MVGSFLILRRKSFFLFSGSDIILEMRLGGASEQV